LPDSGAEAKRTRRDLTNRFLSHHERKKILLLKKRKIYSKHGIFTYTSRILKICMYI